MLLFVGCGRAEKKNRTLAPKVVNTRGFFEIFTNLDNRGGTVLLLRSFFNSQVYIEKVSVLSSVDSDPAPKRFGPRTEKQCGAFFGADAWLNRSLKPEKFGTPKTAKKSRALKKL